MDEYTNQLSELQEQLTAQHDAAAAEAAAAEKAALAKVAELVFVGV